MPCAVPSSRPATAMLPGWTTAGWMILCVGLAVVWGSAAQAQDLKPLFGELHRGDRTDGRHELPGRHFSGSGDESGHRVGDREPDPFGLEHRRGQIEVHGIEDLPRSQLAFLEADHMRLDPNEAVMMPDRSDAK